MWESLDDKGLWQALPEETNLCIEERFFEKQLQFTLGSLDLGYSYNLGSLSRQHPRNKKAQKIRRTTVYWDTPEGGRWVGHCTGGRGGVGHPVGERGRLWHSIGGSGGEAPSVGGRDGAPQYAGEKEMVTL